MSRLQQLFEKKSKNILNIYCTAGFPQLESTVPIMQSLIANGADIIELGMPYSDPLADGEVIQQSSNIALANGITIELLFKQLQNMRSTNVEDGIGLETPVILMGYMNPVMQYGFERFCKEAARVGVDALILPDLPIFEYENFYGSIIEKHGLEFVFLVTPETNEDRVRKLDSLSKGFLYAVSSSSTTGNNKENSGIDAYLQRLQSYQLKNPILVGFGIKDKASFENASKYSSGAIIGTAYIKALMHNNQSLGATTKEFLQNIIG